VSSAVTLAAGREAGRLSGPRETGFSMSPRAGPFSDRFEGGILDTGVVCEK